MWALLLQLAVGDTVGTPGISGIVEPSASTEVILGEGFEATGDYDTACGTVAVRHDTDGINWCPLTTNTAPTSMMISPMDNYGAGSQTPTGLVIRGGIGERSALLTNANCNAADTVTATIGIGNAAAGPCTCTYGTNWCTGTCNTDDLVATSLAACLNACTGIDSTSTAEPTTLQIDPTEGQVRQVRLTTNDATCAAVTNAANGAVVLPDDTPGTYNNGFKLWYGSDTDTGLDYVGANFQCFTAANIPAICAQSTGPSMCPTGTCAESFKSKITRKNSDPTIASGFGTNPSVTGGSGSSSFRVTVGTGGVDSTGTLTMPAATGIWICFVNNLTTPGTMVTRQSGAASTTSVALTNYAQATGLATAWGAGDTLDVFCWGR